MKTLLVLTFSLLAALPSLRAATIDASSSQPTIGSLDVYSYIAPNGSYLGQNDFTNNAYNGNGAPGQTFTPNTSGLLTALTVEGGAGGAGLGYQNGIFNVYIYSVGTDGTTLTGIGGGNFTFASTTTDYSGDYLTFDFANAIQLTAGQQYAFSVSSNAGYYNLTGSETQTTPENVGGTAINTVGTDPASAPSTTIGDSLNFNRNFDAHIEALPEPSTYALLLGGLAFLGFLVRRKLA